MRLLVELLRVSYWVSITFYCENRLLATAILVKTVQLVWPSTKMMITTAYVLQDTVEGTVK